MLSAAYDAKNHCTAQPPRNIRASLAGQRNQLALDTLPLEDVSAGRTGQAPAEAFPGPERALAPETMARFRPRQGRRRPLTSFALNEESPGFYLSLSDLMSLLLVFFVLIFSISGLGQDNVPEIVSPKKAEAAIPTAPAALPGIDPFPGLKPRPKPPRLGLAAVSSPGSPDPGLSRQQRPQAPAPAPAPAPRPAPPVFIAAPAPAGVNQALLTLVAASKPLPPAALPEEKSSLSGLLDDMRENLTEKNGPPLNLESGPGKVVLSLPEAITFDLGRAEIRPAMQKTLARLARVMAQHPDFKVIITGHTDDVPIHNQTFASNWDLSAARAAAVGRALLAQGLKQGRLTIRGLADQSPKAPNDTPENRALNRRVEIELRMGG